MICDTRPSRFSACNIERWEWPGGEARSDVDTGGYTALNFALYDSLVLNANAFMRPLGRVGIYHVLLYNLYSGSRVTYVPTERARRGVQSVEQRSRERNLVLRLKQRNNGNSG